MDRPEWPSVAANALLRRTARVASEAAGGAQHKARTLVAKIPRRVDEHTLTDRIRSLERRLAALEARLAGVGLGDPGLVEQPAPNDVNQTILP